MLKPLLCRRNIQDTYLPKTICNNRIGGKTKNVRNNLQAQDEASASDKDRENLPRRSDGHNKSVPPERLNILRVILEL